MNLKSILVVLVATVAGIFGGAVTYQVAVPAEAQPEASDAIVLKSPGHAARGDKRPAKFAPCRPPAKLEGRRCVTDVVRTVAVPGRSAPVSAPRAQAPAPAAPAPAPAPSGSDWNDDGRHHGGDDESDHHGGDDDDDDHHGGDDDTDTRDTRTGTHTGTQTRTRSHD